MQLRTINLGLSVDWRASAVQRDFVRRFFGHSDQVLGKAKCSALTRRVTTTAMAVSDVGYEALRGLVSDLEKEVSDLWICVPCPWSGDGIHQWADVAYIPRLIAETDNVFCNMSVSSRSGIHLGATLHAARIMRELSDGERATPANFRFAALSNIGPNTPYFPASYHDGPDGFTMALELTPLAQQAFGMRTDFVSCLDTFEGLVDEAAAAAVALGVELADRSAVRFIGVDLSLAPLPGKEMSVVGALESLAQSRAGTAGFMLSLNAVNRVLKAASKRVPRVGYNGTMFSVLEDTVLADRVASREMTIKDLLLCSSLCGCGLDTLPTTQDVTVSQLAGLIQATAVIAHQWHKPLLTRIVPTGVDGQGLTMFDHPFLVNAIPVRSEELAFAGAHPYEGFLSTAGAGQVFRREASATQPGLERPTANNVREA